MNKVPQLIVICAAIFMFGATSFVLAGEMSGPYRTNFIGKAAEGYDVVSYFEEGKAVEGDSDFTHEWKGVKWYFSTAAHKDKFAAAPEKFAPQYGGYCAYAVSKGYTASVDPEAWTIVDGKLYLNYSKGVKDTWDKDRAGYIKSADENWPKVRKDL
ncbi:YHS domain-containing (seleno)protein [Sneathiella limimaris]|uniref:YHS domain-containing (seleno)protein n=1 Tax=Sneathiella limimaris TaxID=1964213 RepID=UPI00146E9A17|nr:YHS domain-containing (seleno)protein [Sneathiella limimaris]